MNFDINSMMQQASKMKEDLQRKQEEFSKKIFEGSAGGGMVKVNVTGNGEMQKINIDKSLFAEDDIAMLEDLVVAAFNNAKKILDGESANNFSDATGGMNIPGLDKLFK